MPRILTRPKPFESDTTPGVVIARLDQRRLLIGSSSSVFLLRFDEKSGDSKFRTGASAVTSTTCVSEPVTRCGVTVVSWPTCTITWFAR